MQKVPGGSGYNQKLEFYRLEKGDELVWIDDVFDNVCADHASAER
jgi:hypothetical protein